MAIARYELPDGRIAKFEVGADFDPQAFQSEVDSMYADGFFDQQAQDDSRPSEGGLLGSIAGGAEVGAVLGSAALAEPLAGLSGLAAAAIPGGKTGPEAIEATREALRYEPRTQKGREYLANTGEALAPLAEAMEGAETYLGDGAFEATGSPALAAAATSIPTAALEALGLGAGKAVSVAARNSKAAKFASDADKLLQQAAPSPDALKAASKTLYQEVDDLGAWVDPNAFRRLAYEVAERTNSKGLDPDITPAANKVVGEMFEKARSGEPMSFSELSKLRQKASGVAGKVTDAQESMLGSMVREHIDDFMGSSGIVDPSMTNAIGGQVTAKLQSARELWGRLRRSEILEEANYKAANQASGYENGIRTQLRSILNNKRKRNAFSPEEIAEMEAVVRGTPSANAMKFMGKFGFSLGNTGNMMGGTVASMAAENIGGKPLAAAVAAGGTAARKLSELATVRGAKRSEAVVRSGRDARAVAKDYLRRSPNPRPEELADLLLRKNVDLPDAVELDEFTKRALQIARDRKAAGVGAAGVGATERGTQENVIPLALR